MSDDRTKNIKKTTQKYLAIRNVFLVLLFAFVIRINIKIIKQVGQMLDLDIHTNNILYLGS